VEKGCKIAVCQMVTAAFDVQLSVNINRKQDVERGGDKNAENLNIMIIPPSTFTLRPSSPSISPAQITIK
jgi:hypothetical protein